MSDVVVSTTKSVTSVSTTDNVTEISITETPVEISSSTAGLQGPPGSNSDPTYVFVRNATGSLLPKGSIVYVSGANGTHTQVTKAIATGDATSARTLGWLAEDIANNASGLCMVEGYLDGVDTQGITEGAQLYLSTTVAGGFQETKPSAPNHLVYVGVAAKASAGNGRVFVKVQNGYELDELHDVQIISKTNKDLLQYDSATNLWKNVASTAITVGSALTSGTAGFAINAGTSVYANSAATAITSGTASYSVLSGTAVTISGSITKSQISDFTSGTVTSASTAQQAGTAVYSVSAGTSDYSVLSGTAVGLSGSIVRSQVSDFSSGTVANAGTAQQAGTAVYAVTSGTADYSVLSGTAVTISGTITNSQVSDFTSGTVANISGTVTQAQVANLTTDLAGKANLVGGNSFTGAQVIATAGTAEIPLVVRGTAGQSANLFEAQNSGSTALSYIKSTGALYFNSNNNTTGIEFLGTSGTQYITANGNDFSLRPRFDTLFAPADTSGRFRPTNDNTSDLGTSGQRWKIVYSSGASIVNSGTALVPLTVRGASGQSADLLQLQNSSGGTVTAIDSSGQIMAYNGVRSNSVTNTTTFNNSRIQISNTGTIIDTGIFNNPALRVQNTNSTATANLTEWLSSAGGTVAYIAPTGFLNINNASLRINTAGASFNARINVATDGTAVIGQVIRGAPSQSANLQEWQNSGGTARAFINASGDIQIPAMVATYSATINSGGTAVVPLTVKGIASQSANLQEWQDSTGGTITRIASAGQLGTTARVTVGQLTISTAGQLSVVGNTDRVQMAVVGNNPQTTDLMQLQTSTGSTVVRANVSGQASFGGTALLGQVTVLPASTATVGVVVQGLSGQSANLQEWQSSTGSTAARVEPSGNIVSGQNVIGLGSIHSYNLLTSGSNATQYGSATLSIGTRGTANSGVIVRGVASQSANLQEWQNSSGGTVASIDSAGIPTFTRQLTVNQSNAGERLLRLTGASNQTADNITIINSGSTVIGGLNTNAQIYTGGTAPITRSLATGISISNATGNGTTATITISSGHGLAVGDRVTISGITSVSGNYNGTYVLSGVTATSISYANTSTGAYTGGGTIVVDAQVSVVARSAATTGLVVRGATSQNVNLQEWQNDAGTVLAYMGSGGAFRTPIVQAGSGAENDLRARNSGGELTMLRQTATSTNPGANYARLYFRAGTNANTLKLVVIAGTAGAETTILDNIPT